MKTKIHVDTYLSIDDLPKECIDEIAQPGRNDEAVTKWREKLSFTVNVKNARKFLDAYGIDNVSSMSKEDLADYVLWMACHDFAEYQEDPENGIDMINLASF